VPIDSSRVAFHAFRTGVGPYGEPQFVAAIKRRLDVIPNYRGQVATMPSPHLPIPGDWAVEFKIVPPFSDNGKEAENRSAYLLHPYPGNVSSIGDRLKLLELHGPRTRPSSLSAMSIPRRSSTCLPY
jgi:hypothetical protein